MEQPIATQEIAKDEQPPPLNPNSVHSTDLPNSTRVWIYVRQGVGNNKSIEPLLAVMKKVIQEKEWVLDKVFTDIGVSSTSTTRESLNLMLYLARQKPRSADVILVRDMPQLARNSLLLQFYLTQLHTDGWKVLSLNDKLPTGPLSPFVQAIIDWKNEQSLEDLKKSTIRGLQYIAKQGCLPGGPIAKGYTYSHKQIGYFRDGMPRLGRKPEIDPMIAPLVVKAFEMKAEGAINRAIATKTGLYSPNASGWTSFFRNKIYLGEYKFHGEIYRDVYPALISSELFEAVQNRFSAKSTSKKNPRVWIYMRHGSADSGDLPNSSELLSDVW